MKRGDVVTVAVPGDYGKPRPAVIVQSDALPAAHASVIVCQMTSVLAEVSFRVTIEAARDNGLQTTSQIMADKPITVRREKIGRRIGHLGAAEISRLNAALAFIMGLTD